MIFWFVSWYLLGLTIWFVFCWGEGFITIGDIAAGTLMGLTGPLVPITLGLWYLFWHWYRICQTVVWRRKDQA